MAKNFILFLSIIITSAKNAPYHFPFMTRAEWGARPPRDTVPLRLPVDNLHLYHVIVPYPCLNRHYCVMSMKYLQDLHQIVNGWYDIGYNFAIGGDEVVYEGRGWNATGAHASGRNNRSISIAFMSEDAGLEPTQNQILRSKQMLTYGLSNGFILPSVTIVNEHYWNPKSATRSNPETKKNHLHIHLRMPWWFS